MNTAKRAVDIAVGSGMGVDPKAACVTAIRQMKRKLGGAKPSFLVVGIGPSMEVRAGTFRCFIQRVFFTLSIVSKSIFNSYVLLNVL